MSCRERPGPKARAPARDDKSAAGHSLPPGVTLKGQSAHLIEPRSWSFRTERLDHPGLAAFRAREGLDAVVAPGKTEFDRMRLLSAWVNSQWKAGTPDPYPPWDAAVILDQIRAGKTGGFCAQYAVVMVQSCLCLGWQARYLDIANEKEGAGHFTSEVWSNQYNRWVLLDASMDFYFERDGMPLSGLEVHDALVSGSEDTIKVVRGQGAHAWDNSPTTDPELFTLFYHLAADLRTDHLSRPASFWDRHDYYLSWKDQATNGRPEVFYWMTADALDFNFPLNQVVVRLEATSDAGVLRCMVRTNTPDLAGLEVSRDGADWARPGRLSGYPGPDLDLPAALLSPHHGYEMYYYWQLAAGDNKLKVRAINTAGVAGPEAFVGVSYNP